MSENKILPKVLIYGETFRKLGGGGITLNTLFGDWPTENLFMLNNKYDETSKVHFTHFYQIGSLETKTFLNRIGFKKPNTSISKIAENNRIDNLKNNRKKFSWKTNLYFELKKIFVSVINFIGIYEWFFTIKVSPELIQWLKQVSPNTIYFQPSSIENIKFILELHKKTGIPYVVHIMDNFFDTVNKGRLFQKGNELIFNELIEKSNLCLGICEEMSTQYKKRFNREFYSYQHAVDHKFWYRNYQVRRNPSPFIILYAGRIGIGTRNSLFLLSEAIQNCNKKHKTNFEFWIQTTSFVPKVLDRLSNYRCVKLQTLIPYEDLPDRFAKADLLVLPMDFDSKGLSYIKYSMPTKVPEYLVTGVPILVLANNITALYKYAKSAKWAFLNDSENLDDLENSLLEIFNNLDKRIETSQTATKVGISNHDIKKIRNSFKNQISESCHRVI